MAAYNEQEWIEKSVQRVLGESFKGIHNIELVVVDDGSTDGTREILKALARENPEHIKAIFHEKNLGKGAAIRSAIDRMTGDVCIIQDADLEYDPADYNAVLEPILEGKADCVYGSRLISTGPKRVFFFWHLVGNKFITLLSNMLSNFSFTDVETGYKAFRASLLKSIPIRSNDFAFEVEITAKIARLKCRVYEVGISYMGRTYAEGKKINWVDGLRAIFTILRFWIINDTVKKEA